MRNYSGILDYLDNSNDYIKVNDFLVDDNEAISFDLITTWGDKREYRYSSEEVPISNGVYIVRDIYANDDNVSTSKASTIEFRVSPDRKERVAVFGTWHYAGKKYLFLGALDHSFRANAEEIHVQLGHNLEVFRLMSLIENGDYGRFSEIITNNPSVVTEPLSPEDGQEALLTNAIAWGSFDCAKILIENGANVNLVLDTLAYEGNNLLGYALRRGEFQGERA